MFLSHKKTDFEIISKSVTILKGLNKISLFQDY